jgi:hypothetical protein
LIYSISFLYIEDCILGAYIFGACILGASMLGACILRIYIEAIRRLYYGICTILYYCQRFYTILYYSVYCEPVYLPIEGCITLILIN